MMTTLLLLFSVIFTCPPETPSQEHTPAFYNGKSSKITTEHYNGIKIMKEHENKIKLREIHYRDNLLIKGIYWNRAGKKTKEVIYHNQKIVSLKEWYGNKTLKRQDHYHHGNLIHQINYRVTGEKQKEISILKDGTEKTIHYAVNGKKWFEELRYKNVKTITYFYIQNKQKHTETIYIAGEKYLYDYQWYPLLSKKWHIDGTVLSSRLSLTKT